MYTITRIVMIAIAFVSLLAMPFYTVFADTIEQERARLEAELRELEQQIVEQEYKLEAQRQESGSISRDLDIIQSEIDKKRLEITSKNRQIYQLTNEIQQKQRTILSLQDQLGREQGTLERLLRRSYEREQDSFMDFAISSITLSDMFDSLVQYSVLQASLHESIDSIRDIRAKTEEERKDLESKKTQELDLKVALEEDKREVEVKEDEKQELLEVSKNKEQTYEQVLAERRKRAAQIRSALFELRDQDGIPFGEAYEYALVASDATGVRPAFILAILTQESNMGKNVGTCNRPGDTQKWQDIMPGPNDNSWRDDHASFLRITSKLGISPEGQPLSCPLSAGTWGGAMGPSQFIPTTWESYEDRIARAVGAAVANPWNPQHAITATALYVQDLGAGKQTWTAEREAACKYYSGRGCHNPNVRNMFYGNAVMEHAERIQSDIDVLKSV